MNGITSNIPVKGFEDSSGVGQRALVNSDNRQEVYAVGGKTADNDISTSSVIKTGTGVLVQVNVLVAGAAGAVHDCATTGAAAAGNKIAVIPAVVGTYVFNWPVTIGIVYIPGASQVVSISFI